MPAEDVVIEGTFTIETFTVIGTIDNNGTIEISNEVVDYDGSSTVTWTLADGYKVVEVKVNGQPVAVTGNEIVLVNIVENTMVDVRTAKGEYDYIVNYYVNSVNGELLKSENSFAEFGQTVEELKVNLNKYILAAGTEGAYKDGYITSDSIKVIGASENIINVVYEPIMVKVTVEVVDENGNIIGETIISEGQATTVITDNLTPVISEEYIVVEKPILPSEYPTEDAVYRYVAIKATEEMGDIYTIKAFYETEYNSNDYKADENKTVSGKGQSSEDEAKAYADDFSKSGYTYNDANFVATSEKVIVQVTIKAPVTTGTSIVVGGDVTTDSAIGSIGDVTTGSAVDAPNVSTTDKVIDVEFTKWIYELYFDKDYVAPPIDPEPPVDPRPPVDPEPPVDPRPPVDPEPPVDPRPPVDPKPPANPEPPVDPEPQIEIEEEEVPGGPAPVDPEPPVEIEDEEIPGGVIELPNTGGLPSDIFYGLGALSMMTGVLYKFKRKKDNDEE